MKYIKTYEKFGDDYSDWKTYQLFNSTYQRGTKTYQQACITMKYDDQIRKIYEYDTYKNNKNKIVKVKAFYFTPDLNNPNVIYQSDDFDDIYKKFVEVTKDIKIYLDAKEFNL